MYLYSSNENTRQFRTKNYFVQKIYKKCIGLNQSDVTFIGYWRLNSL